MAAPGMGRVKRRIAACVAAGVLLLSQDLLSLAAYAQQADKLPRVGVLTNQPPTSAYYAAQQGAFRQALRDLGYIEGKNITFDTKSAQGNVDLFPELARELAGANVNVMVVAGEQALRAAKEATATKPIPIVALLCGPDRLMASLARPGGNATAVSCMSTDQAAKRVQMLKELVPALANIAVLYNPQGDRTRDTEYKQVQEAANSLDLQLRAYEARSPTEIDKAFALVAVDHPQALVILGDVLMNVHLKVLADLALRNRLPAIYLYREFVDVGGLISYGASLKGMWLRAAPYVDKILKGADAGELPIDQPTRFELVINLKTAKILGIQVPASLLVAADEETE